MLQTEHLRDYQRRLTNLDQGNRALKHLRLSPRRDIDLEAFSYLEGKSVDELLWALLRGRKATLIKRLSARVEQTNVLDTRLKKIHRTLSQTEAETGLYDFNLGYPFVEGKFADGSVCRAPLMLIPVRLVRGGTRARWQLEVRDNAESVWNTVFLRAYERYTDVRIPAAFWARNPLADADDLQAVLNALYAAIKTFDLQIDFQSQTHTQHVAPFRDVLAATTKRFEQGMLKLQPYAVLGVYPQSDAAILADYDTIGTWTHFPQWQTQDRREIVIDDCPDDEYTCLPVDESQLRALRAVRAGESIALQGPPGTGKSQWIVNLVGDYLMRNKRVLVVSQKRAALEVVYQRLATLNFGPFCYLIHDFREDRRRIYNKLSQFLAHLPDIEQRQQTYQIARARREYETLGAQIRGELDQLGALGEALTRVRHHGLSVLDMYARIDPDLAAIDIPFALESLHVSDLEQFRLRLRQLLEYQTVFDHAHPWGQRKALYTLNSLELRKWRHLADKLPEVCGQLEASYAGLNKEGYFLLENPKFDTQIDRYLEVVNGLLHSPEDLAILTQWLSAPLSTPQRRMVHSNLLHLANAIQDAQYIDLADLKFADRLEAHTTFYLEQQPKWLSLLSGDYRRTKATLKAFFEDKGYSLSTVNWTVWGYEIKLLQDFILIAAGNSLPDCYHKLIECLDVNHIQCILTDIDRVVSLYQDLQALAHWPVDWPDFRKETDLEQELSYLRDELLHIRQHAADWRHRNSELQYYFGETVTGQFISCIREGECVCRVEIEAYRESAARDYDAMLAADSLLETLSTEARRIFTAVIQPKLPTDSAELLSAMTQGLLRNWLTAAEREDPQIRQTEAKYYDLELDLLRTRWQRRQALAQELVLHTLQTQVVARQEYNRLGNPVTYREIRHQVNKQRQIWPLRKLIAQAWESGLDHLMPCVLASPETVSAVFPMHTDWFDLVVFDEASQCAVERALPAMLRAPQVAVVGDHQQLQPLNLFRAEVHTEAADDLETAAWQESESLLDLARQQFNEYMLTWHYRSQVQALVEFSNREFYFDRLQVLPNKAISQTSPPFIYHEVPGRWVDNVNTPEAEAIVARVIELTEGQPTLSVGVITFNQKQQDCILDLIESRIPKLRSAKQDALAERLEVAIAGTSKTEGEGLFVKNIENVQGNERDLILFSVGYGPNANGEIRANFGLLNRINGENRLNVAITRARTRMEIFASFAPWKLKVAHTKHAGPKMLKAFLQYAYTISHSTWPPEPDTNMRTAPEMARLNPYFAKRGYTLVNMGRMINEPFYGLAPRGGSDCVAGIVFTAERFYNQRSALSRSVIRPLQLASREWPVYYLWARRFWRNPQEAVDTLLERIEKEQRHTTTTDTV